MVIKTLIREIKGHFGRFVAILAIVALGIGLFCGLRLCKPSMIKTLDLYAAEHNMYDYQLISTLGLNDEDVEAISELDFVSEAEGAIYKDYQASLDGKNFEPVRFFALPESINTAHLKAGRMPENENECLLDALYVTEEYLGATVTIIDEDDSLSTTTFTVVGLANSPLFINFQRGTTSLPPGSLTMFGYLPKEAFTLDYYTEIYLKVEGADGEVYSAEYEDAVLRHEDELTAVLEERANLRYESLRAEAEDIISGHEEEYNEGRDEYYDGVRELANAKIELQDAEKEIADAEAEIVKGEEDIAKHTRDYEDGLKKLWQGEREYSDGLAEYEEGLALYNENLALWKENSAKLDSEYAKLKSAENELDELMQGKDLSKLSVQEVQEYLDATYEQLIEAVTLCNEAALQYKAINDRANARKYTAQAQQYKADAEKIATLDAQTLKNNEKQIRDGYAECEKAKAELASAKTELDNAAKELESAKQELDSAASTIAYNRRKLNDAAKELEDGKAEIEQAKLDIADAKIELADGWAEYEEGRLELEDAKAQLDEGKKELDDAREKIDAIDEASTYVLTRDTNLGYVSFENDTNIVHDISVVFPLFFFLVAALICMTTMTRMIDEQRTQIGIYKALGYSKAAIMAKYLLYSGAASLVGSAIGGAAGAYLFPGFIWKAYNIMYGFSELTYAFDWPLVIISSAAFIACCVLATWYSCSRELSEKPASLIRPKAAKAGKRILLERIGFVWKRLPFLSKVTARNIFRYHQRLIIMILGIGGCTALLLTGFGIRDSIKDVGNYQYGEISVYDSQVGFDGTISTLESHAFLRRYDDALEGACFLNQASMDISANGVSKNIAVCTASEGTLDGFFNLRDEGKNITFPGPGEVSISHGLAISLGVLPGDTIVIAKDGMSCEATVCSLFENYVQNYAVICPRTYLDAFGEPAGINEAFLNFREGTDSTEIATRLSEDEQVNTVIICEERLSYLNDMLDSLKYITLVIIICAASLAFIVIYNLTNINITERIREIATIKVLGFHTGETSRYVFSENLILTLIGSFVGLPLGIFLHRFVMANIKIDSIRFDVRIIPASYVLSVALTLLFAIVIYSLMQIKLKRIDMAQALKSNE